MKRLLRAEREAIESYKVRKRQRRDGTPLSMQVAGWVEDSSRIRPESMRGMFAAFGLRMPADWEAAYQGKGYSIDKRVPDHRSIFEVATVIEGIIERMDSYVRDTDKAA